MKKPRVEHKAVCTCAIGPQKNIISLLAFVVVATRAGFGLAIAVLALLGGGTMVIRDS